VDKIIGIDLGTTNSLVATVDSGIPLVIADAAGWRLTPSVVHFPAVDTEPIVGHEASRVRVVKPAETVYSVKRFIGRRGAEISDEEKQITYPLKTDGAGVLTIPIYGKIFSPEEISAAILKIKAGRGNLFRRTGHTRGYYGAGVFQRHAAQRNPACGRACRIHRRTHRQRADRRCARLRVGQAQGKIKNRRL
jgi:hypothetical protein